MGFETLGPSPKDMGIEGEFRKEQKPEVKEIPGRSWLKLDSELAKKEHFREEHSADGYITAEIIKEKDYHGRELYKKAYSYVREQGADNIWRNTDKLKSISEERYAYNNKGQKSQIEGHDLHQQHAWRESQEHDEQGNLKSRAGKVTEGEKVGDEWNANIQQEQKGKYTKIVETNSGMHYEGQGEQRQLVPFKTVTVEYKLGGQSVWGWQDEEGKPDKSMKWGSRPEDLQEEKKPENPAE